jgi:hypothetical protein
MVNVKEALQRAADHIETVGWTQRQAFDRSDDRPLDACPACALGALDLACFAPNYREGSLEAYREGVQLLRDATGAIAIPEWNDAPGRTKEEVVAAFRKAASLP